jgi:hypothetical protein
MNGSISSLVDSHRPPEQTRRLTDPAHRSNMTTSKKQGAMFGAGMVVLIVGLLTAIGLWYSAGQREADAVRNLARAPSGCATTLDFETAGEFTIYIETAGRYDEPIAGDCVADDEYSVVSESVPVVALAMTSPAGDDVELTNASGITYDVDGFTGQSVRTFRVETPGDHILRVQTPGDPDIRLAVAVGRDPSDGVGTMQLGAVLAALVAVVIGGGLMIGSRRSSAPEPAAAAAKWPTGPQVWPTTPPCLPAAPTPQGWQPAVGPPTHAPQAPLGASSPEAPAGWPPQPAVPATPPKSSGPLPGGRTPSDGSSSDGQRSPWAPPSDAAQ